MLPLHDSMEVVRRVWRDGQPCFIQGFDDRLRYNEHVSAQQSVERDTGLTQRPFLQINHILVISPGGERPPHRVRTEAHTHLLDVVEAGRADNDRVAVLALHEAVVRDPAERDLRHRQAVRLRDLLYRGERVEVRLVPVSGGQCSNGRSVARTPVCSTGNG